MAFIAAQCTKCNGTITVDDTKDIGICEYCGMEYIVEKTIHNHIKNETNHITNNYSGATINVVDDDEDDFDKWMKKGTTYLKLEDYDLAVKTFNDLVREYPYEYLGYVNLIVALTVNFNDLSVSTDTILKLKTKIERIINENQKKHYQKFAEKINLYIEKIEIEETLKKYKEDLIIVQSDMESTQNQIELFESQKRQTFYTRFVLLILNVFIWQTFLSDKLPDFPPDTQNIIIILCFSFIAFFTIFSIFSRFRPNPPIKANHQKKYDELRLQYEAMCRDIEVLERQFISIDIAAV